MKFRNRTRLSLEKLEDRWCPALTTNLVAGTLSISGAPTGAISIVQDSTTAGTITVSDNGVPVTATPFTGVNNLKLKLTAADDTVSIDLGGKTLAGKIYADLGNGKNSLTILDGIVGGDLQVQSGSGTDTVVLGDSAVAAPAFTVTKNTYIDLGDAIDDVLTVHGNTTLNGYLSAEAANNITLDAASDVKKNVFIVGGTGGNTVLLNGTVEGSVDYFSPFFGVTAGANLTVGGIVDGSVTFVGTKLADSFTITSAGSVGRSVFAFMGAGDDTLTLHGAVTGGLYLDAGNGANNITLDSIIGGRTTIYGGNGVDTLTMTANAKFLDTAVISLGAGNDVVSLDNAATFTTMLVNGGSGTNTFTLVGGTLPKTGLTLLHF
ncbi:MAG TPA: hypothetical protein VE988_12830 [Gemmataceae bacterium]|nr:hypothetical protein [Gemmataceae bacterium]